MIQAGTINISTQDGILEIMNIFGECMYLFSNGEDIVDSPTCEQFSIILNSIKDGVGEVTLKHLFEQLPPNSQTGLQSILQ